MIAIKPTQVRDNFKAICDRVVRGETIFVSRPNNENVMIVSEKAYNDMQKTARNAAYLATVDQAMTELERGHAVVKMLNELRKHE